MRIITEEVIISEGGILTIKELIVRVEGWKGIKIFVCRSFEEAAEVQKKLHLEHRDLLLKNAPRPHLSPVVRDAA